MTTVINYKTSKHSDIEFMNYIDNYYSSIFQTAPAKVYEYLSIRTKYITNYIKYSIKLPTSDAQRLLQNIYTYNTTIYKVTDTCNAIYIWHHKHSNVIDIWFDLHESHYENFKYFQTILIYGLNTYANMVNITGIQDLSEYMFKPITTPDSVSSSSSLNIITESAKPIISTIYNPTFSGHFEVVDIITTYKTIHQLNFYISNSIEPHTQLKVSNIANKYLNPMCGTKLINDNIHMSPAYFITFSNNPLMKHDLLATILSDFLTEMHSNGFYVNRSGIPDKYKTIFGMPLDYLDKDIECLWNYIQNKVVEFINKSNTFNPNIPYAELYVNHMIKQYNTAFNLRIDNKKILLHTILKMNTPIEKTLLSVMHKTN